MKNVIADVDDSVYKFFLNHRCEAGVVYMFAVCNILRYIMIRQGVNGLVRVYYSAPLKVPVVNVDIQENLSQPDLKWTAQIIDKLVAVSISRLYDVGDYECVKEIGVQFPIIYSSYNVVVL